jgi:hypothetical protein
MNYQEIMYNEVKSLKIENQIYEMIIPLEFGIRITSFLRKGDHNFLGEGINISKENGNDTWYIRGGHRLWHTPEKFPRTYMPDNKAVSYEVNNEEVILTQQVNDQTLIQKQLKIKFVEKGERVSLEHVLINKGQWPIETAAWGITILRTGGIAKVPLNTRKDDLLSTKIFSVWSYCHLGDERINFNEDYFTLKQDTSNEKAFKIGTNNEEGWASYTEGGYTFTKFFDYEVGEAYPDHGCSFETYTNDKILELETLSPIQVIDSGEVIRHFEEWAIKKEE